MDKKTMKRTHAATIAGLLLALMLVSSIGADHIRDMTARQSGANGNEVTVQFDFNPSGNCCGGALFFDIGENPPTFGSVPDGISNGAYIGDQPLTTTAFASDPNRYFQWERVEIQSAPQLIRITITWEYLNPGVYMVAWNDCCPASEGTTMVVAGAPTEPRKILSLETSRNYAWEALRVAGFFDCADPAAGIICHDRVSVSAFLGMDQWELDEYDVLYVGSNMDASTLAALNTQAPLVKSFLNHGGGVVTYSQASLGSPAYGWLPSGSLFVGLSGAGDDVELTVRGQAHMSYMNQFSPTVSNWGYSRTFTFSSWPSYMDGSTTIPGIPTPVSGPVATGSTLMGNQNKAVSLAAEYGNGCIFASGQPIDAQAHGDLLANAPQSAAQQLVRTTIEYAIDCVELATSQIGP